VLADYDVTLKGKVSKAGKAKGTWSAVASITEGSEDPTDGCASGTIKWSAK
jgi:hypothetical protein